MENANFKRPPALGFFWWQNYFSDNPATVFKTDTVAYSRNGEPVSNGTRNVNYYEHVYCPTCHHHGCYYWSCYSCDCCHGCGNDMKDFGTAILIIIIIVVVICLAILIWLYPSLLAFFWLVMTSVTIADFSVNTAEICRPNQIYSLISIGYALTISLALSIIVWVRFRQLYGGFYPGTPGIYIDVQALLKFLANQTKMYKFLSLFMAGMMVYGAVTAILCNTSAECRRICTWSQISKYTLMNRYNNLGNCRTFRNSRLLFHCQNNECQIQDLGATTCIYRVSP
jgi:hypothetical protein